MYITSLLIFFINIKLSYSSSFYAGFTFTPSDLGSEVVLPGSFFNKLYFYYSNTLVINAEKKIDNTYKHLDHIASGLSLFTDPVYELNKLPKEAKNKHLLGTLESWCHVLTFFIFYSKYSDDIAYQNISIFKHLFDRCMNLNYNYTKYKVEQDFLDILLKTDVNLDDVYLFEKFSQMFPRPTYFQKTEQSHCKTTSLSDLDVVNEFASHSECYLNDFFLKKWTPYSQVSRKALNSFKALLNPDSNLKMYFKKWSYLYMPKRTEFELSLDTLSYHLFMKFVSNCNTRNCQEIKDLLSSVGIKNRSVKFVVGQVDLKAKNSNDRFKISFGITFNMDDFRASTVNHTFDFAIKNVDFNHFYDLLLGPHPFVTYNVENNDQTVKKTRQSKLRYLYNKYMEYRLNKMKQQMNTDLLSKDFFSNKVEFQNLTGLGQHRSVTFTMTINPKIFKRVAPTTSKYYLKVTHMLDSSVYIDNNELPDLFHMVEDDEQGLKMRPSRVVEKNGVGYVELTVLSTPFIDTEQPELNSSPVIYNGYLVLLEADVKVKQLVVYYTLNLHTRYMNMHKALSPELSNVDNLRLLRSIPVKEYSVSLVSPPSLYILNYPKPFEEVPVQTSYVRYLRFLRKISFENFSKVSFPRENSTITLVNSCWTPVYFHQCNNSNTSVKLCKSHRTGLATSTKVVNTYYCNPMIREMGGDVVDSSCYLYFSVPIGDQNEYRFIKNMTVATLLFSCVLSLGIVLRYITFNINKENGKEKKK